ncbi:NAD-dependent epimerase/dehydratase family protein [Pseudoduganella eburnea]|uniref:NAD-dependent epimerase/dehydratase family protein n=1 Tax=Massilia eburnea TaxID=1776165 RepID=A0A6L6QPM7_9BURK|nr:NAD-dependent epimerase/dehydratase family protein [Massilia eburnea]MTW13857.1 NAD-dependent epimerase/dehydratase family protein [Massilia eburnea]
MKTNRTALVLGASGGIGGEMARQLAAKGWKVRALKRGLGVPSRLTDGVEWIEGDAMNAPDVAKAAEACKVIVHAVNPPGYRGWGQQVLPMIDNTIAAASVHGATVVLPGTVYNFGPDAFPVLREDSPQRPVTRKGKIRVEMEARLRKAAEDGQLRAIVVRAGDFIGPGARNNWLSQGIIRPGEVPTQVKLPNARGVGHQYAYLPDVAATMIALLEKDGSLPAFASYNFGGYWDSDGAELGRAIQRVVAAHGAKAPALKAFPWWMIRLVAPFNETLREMMEMRYLWQQPVRMDNRLLREVLGAEPHTPLETALARTLAGLGCLPGPAGRPAAVTHPKQAQVLQG